MSSYQETIGIPHSGCIIYEVGELSIMQISFIGRPSWDISLTNTPFTNEQCSLNNLFVQYRCGSMRSIKGSAYWKIPLTKCETYFGQTGSVNNKFKIVRHLSQKVFCAWPLHDVNVADSVFNFDWNCVVLIAHWVKLRVHKCLVQI